ncbi:hypothetical protein MBLNU459_g3493t1 [Dothideomycetes sp. NU459]
MQRVYYYEEGSVYDTRQQRRRSRSLEDARVPRAPSPPSRKRYHGGQSQTNRTSDAPRARSKIEDIIHDHRLIEDDGKENHGQFPDDHGVDVKSRYSRATRHRKRRSSASENPAERYEPSFIDPATIHTDNEADRVSNQLVLGWLDSIVEEPPLANNTPMTRQPEPDQSFEDHYRHVRGSLREPPTRRKDSKDLDRDSKEDRVSIHARIPRQADLIVSHGEQLFIPPSWDGSVIRVPSDYTVITPPSYYRTRIGGNSTEAPRRQSVPLMAATNDRIYSDELRYRICDDQPR